MSKSKTKDDRRLSAIEGQRYTSSALLKMDEYAWLRNTHYLKTGVAKREKKLDNALRVLWKDRWIEISLVRNHTHLYTLTHDHMHIIVTCSRHTHTHTHLRKTTMQHVMCVPTYTDTSRDPHRYWCFCGS